MVRRADPETIAKCRAIQEEIKAKAPGEVFADLIALGIINERGQVLYGDERPAKISTRKSNGTTAKKKKPAAKKSTNGKSSNGKHS